MTLPVEIGDRVVAAVAVPLAVVFTFGGHEAALLAADAATTDPLIAYGGLGAAVLGFAGILVRMLVKQSSQWQEIVTSLRNQLKDTQVDIDRKDDQIAYITWEREAARYRAKERPDPGPAPTFRVRSAT